MFIARFLPLLLLAFQVVAAGLPPDAAIDPKQSIPTLVPRAIPNSGVLLWAPHDLDLTAWVTLSHLDTRASPKPQKVTFNAPLKGDAARGRLIMLDPKLGGCIFCHEIPGEDWPGSIGPPLLHYKLKQSSSADLYQKIYDVRVSLPMATMPAFGSLGILNDQEIRDVVAFLQSLE